MHKTTLTTAFSPPAWSLGWRVVFSDVDLIYMWRHLFLPCLDVMQEVQKYFKILLWKKKKDGFCKNKNNIFSRTGLTGSLSPQRASRLFALPCPIYPHGGVQFLVSAALDADPGGERPSRLTRWCRCGRLQGPHSKYSDTILNLGIYMYKDMYIPVALYTAHCTKAYSFPRGL